MNHVYILLSLFMGYFIPTAVITFDSICRLPEVRDYVKTPHDTIEIP